MRIDRVRIQNYRSYKDSGKIDINNKLVIVGENNAGKSNILRAIDMFLDVSPTTPHEIQDFHSKTTEEDIEIDIWFDNLTDEEEEKFSDYTFDGELWVKTVYPFDDEKGVPENKDFVVQTQVPAIEDFRNIDDKNADKVEKIYNSHEEKLKPHRPEDWSGKLYKNEIVPTVKNYLQSDDAETEAEEIISPRGIKKLLREYLPDFQYFESDRNIEKETKTSTNALLGRLLQDAFDSVPEDDKEEIEKTLKNIDQQLNEEDKFDEIKTLEREIKQKLNSHMPVEELELDISVPDLDDMLSDVDGSIDDGVKTDIEKMGSGLHTSFILACLWQLSDQNSHDQDIVFGLEEPENDLHPHAQRQLYDTVGDLANQDYQVFMSTHSSLLININDLFDTVRIEKKDSKSVVRSIDQSTFDGSIESIKSKIRIENNEMFFARAVLLVEGESELRTLPVLNSMLHKTKDEIYAFDRLGISVLEVEGKPGFTNFLRITNAFNIPSIVMIDNDRDKDEYHEQLVSLVEERADEVIELPEDLEHQFFKVMSFSQFCDVMDTVTEYSKTPENLRQKRDGQNISEEEVLRQEFNRIKPSKPQFGGTLADELSPDEIPSDLKDILDRCREMV